MTIIKELITYFNFRNLINTSNNTVVYNQYGFNRNRLRNECHDDELYALRDGNEN